MTTVFAKKGLVKEPRRKSQRVTVSDCQQVRQCNRHQNIALRDAADGRWRAQAATGSPADRLSTICLGNCWNRDRTFCAI